MRLTTLRVIFCKRYVFLVKVSLYNAAFGVGIGVVVGWLLDDLGSAVSEVRIVRTCRCRSVGEGCLVGCRRFV